MFSLMRLTSASATWARTVMVSRLATCKTTGAVWLALSVCPSLVGKVVTRLEIGLGLLNLRDDRVHLGFFHRGLGFGLLQSLLADGIDGDQILVALQILFGQNRLGLLLIELGAQTI